MNTKGDVISRVRFSGYFYLAAPAKLGSNFVFECFYCHRLKISL